MTTDPMIAYVAHVSELIDRYGWAVQGVMPTSGDPQPPWFYTAGMTAFDHPEFCVAARLSPEVATALLNDLGDRVHAGQRFTDGQTLPDLVRGFTVALRAVAVDDPDWPFNMARLFYQGWRVRGLQVVLPDMAGRFPWDRGYDVAGQVLLPAEQEQP